MFKDGDPVGEVLQVPGLLLARRSGVPRRAARVLRCSRRRQGQQEYDGDRFLAKMLNPFSRLKKNIKRSEGTKGNLVGEGLVHGGVYVVPPGGKPFYAHAEVELGDHPPTEELLTALPQLAPIELPQEPVSVEAVSVETAATLTSPSTSMSPSRAG